MKYTLTRLSLLSLLSFASILPQAMAEGSSQPAPVKKQEAAAHSDLVIPQHPAVRRMMLEMIADGMDAVADKVEKNTSGTAPEQDKIASELDFLQKMKDSYSRVNRTGLPSQYVAYLDAMTAWLTEELPPLMEKAKSEGSEIVLAAYEKKLEELSTQYPRAHATLTSKNNEFKNLLVETGIDAQMEQSFMDNQETYIDDPVKFIIDHSRAMSKLVRAKAAEQEQGELGNTEN